MSLERRGPSLRNGKRRENRPSGLEMKREDSRNHHEPPAIGIMLENHLIVKSLHRETKGASVRLGPKTLRTLDEEVKSLVSAWRLHSFSS